ncbi:MAG: Crp/Fnr family transcriptional regulator [Bacteroidetes bacterium GWF2_33_16]|nr:MAG: Crp/Fnr family transcriptional regulator [Bacteroidetes bacterium GWE2_32_14]OFY03432.1 MAG: Crp/Fnr family transcriptional regulator [Bacteroidetes bacterium GWF2_33_16]OFY96096.1 MAG: Crp/Fnr family transcriptional regulator [Bacteroidetes bacterium RIFOXYC12_FULL_35_7]
MKNRDLIPFCETCINDFDTIFRHLTPEEHQKVNQEKVCNFYKRGNVIYHEGSRTNGFYCLNSGVLKIFKTGIDGREQIIAFAKKGDLIGFRSILSGELACSSAKVIEDAVLCFIPGETLISLVKTNGNFSLAMMQLTCKELGVANAYITDIAQKTVRERLAEVLLKLMDTFNLDDDNVLQVSLTREELSNIVGTATESVIRLLSEFKQDKLIDINGRKIKILDVKRLEKISNAFN